MTEFERAIEEARRQHLQRQCVPSDYVYTKTLYQGAANVQALRNKAIVETERTIRKAVGYKESLRQVYAPLIYKRIVLSVSDAIFNILKEGKIIIVKPIYNEYKDIKERWRKALHSPEVPKESEDLTDCLSDWCLDSTERKTIGAMQKEYLRLLLCDTSATGNYADLLAWVMTAIRLSDVIIEHDEEVLDSVKRIAGNSDIFAKRNKEDVAIILNELLTKLAKALYGNIPNVSSSKLNRLSCTIKQHMKEYDADEFLSQYEARCAVGKQGGLCEAETCLQCDKYPCNMLKEYRIEARQHITKVEEMYG